MENTNTQQQNGNIGNGNDNEKDATTITSLLTPDMKSSLWYDNNSMYTSSEAVDQFNGIISRQLVKELTEYIIDGADALPADSRITQIVPILNSRGGTRCYSETKTGTINPAMAQTDNLHWERTNWVGGGYKFTTDTNKLTTIIDKRLENDLGQQSEEGNRVFRSNVYVSMDVDIALALEGQSRVCKTGEVILESEYAYSSPKVDYSNANELTYVIIDHNDYNNSNLRSYLQVQPPEVVFTISETNRYDVIAAIGRYVRALESIVDNNVRKYSRYFFVLSNAQNPLKCARCVCKINGNIIGDDYTKFRFGSGRQLAAATGKALNTIQNYDQYVYNYLEVDYNNVGLASGTKTFAASVNTSYTDYTAWGGITGTAITWPTADGSMPVSRQKWNIQDYYTALQYLVEYHYKVSTPYDKLASNVYSYADWSLLYSTSDNYGSTTLPIAPYAVRLAADKNMISAINDHTHGIEHRGILGSKLKVLANYRAGRLLGTITETFGSLFNLTKISDSDLVGLYNEILDAQTVGIYGKDHLLGMIGHFKYVPTNPDFIANNPRGGSAFSNVADPTNDDLTVEEYWPVANYWRSDTFGLPTVDELDYQVKFYPAGTSLGWKDCDKMKYLVASGSVCGKITYQFDRSVDPISASVIFQSKFGSQKSAGCGMYIAPGLFSCDCVISIKDRPNADGLSTSNLYVVCTGNRSYTAQLNKNLGTTNRAKLFG